MRIKALKAAVALILLLAVLACEYTAVAQEEETGIITADPVNMRAEPNKDSQLVNTLPLGTEVQVLSNEGSWYLVMYGDEVGYIRQDYVFINSGESRGAYVLDDGAVLRGGPSQDAYVVCELSAGQGVKVKTIVGEWYFVSVNDQAGYVHRTYLMMSSSTTAAGGSMLKMGMEGAEVKKLQSELYSRGFLSKSDITGAYGANTRKAVSEYQKAYGISADGIAGNATLNSLYDSTNKLKKENATYNQLKGTVIMLNWFDGGSDWLAKGAKFTITDVRTGLSFRARRFGGWYHADCEPITAADTAIMKRAAGGSWTWNRRPIWVTYAGKTVAASMHSMPHMANPTKSNGFDGHFCIHLKGSKVHETSKECPRHQACVYEAYKAGKPN